MTGDLIWMRLICVIFVDTFFSLNKEKILQEKAYSNSFFFDVLFAKIISLNICDRHIMDTSIRNILQNKINTSMWKTFTGLISV